MVLTCLFARNKLLQTGQGTERVNDNLTDVAVTTEEQLAFRDITRIVGHGMRNVATGQSRHRNNRDGTAAWELHRLFVYLRQVRIKGPRHGVLRRNLVHTVGHDGERIGVGSHIRQQHQHLFIIVHSEIFGSRQCHIRNQQTLYRRILGGIHKADDTVERTGIGEYVLEVKVVIVRHTHTAKDNLVSLRTQSHIRHHLVERLVGVGKERNLLSGHQRIVQVDTCNTGCNQFRRLLTAHRIHRRTANFHLLTFNGRTTVDGVAKGVEEASGKLLAHFDCRSLAQEYYLCIGGNTFRTLKHLQSHFVAGNLHHLGQLAVYGRQLVIPHSGCLQRTRSFRNLSNLGIYFLKCFCCHLFIYNLAIYYLLFKSLPSYFTIFLSTTSVHLHPQGK